MAKRKIYNKTCKNCNHPFTAYRPHAKFCSDSCRMEYWRKKHPMLTADERKQIMDKLNIKENE